jgi:hypothetical protein
MAKTINLRKVLRLVSRRKPGVRGIAERLTMQRMRKPAMEVMNAVIKEIQERPWGHRWERPERR